MTNPPLIRVILAAFCVFGALNSCALAEKYLVFVGTYSPASEAGIHVLTYDEATGDIAVAHAMSGVASPSFLALSPSGQNLYAVSEVDDLDGQPTGGVVAMKFDPASKSLTRLNAQATGGQGPCHLIVAPSGRFVLAANYSGGSVCSIAVNEDGSLGKRVAFIQHEGGSVDKSRQEGPHAHSINLDASGQYAFVADLGKDEVLIYKFDSATGALTPNDPPSVKVRPGGGPRHFAFHPNGKFAFSNLEMTSEVTAFAYDAAKGSLREVHRVSTLPAAGAAGNSTAEIVVSPDGKHVYCSNRGHDSLVGYKVNADTGALSLIDWFPTLGKTPRNFNITPSGQTVFAANQSTNNLVLFHRDAETGRLRPTGKELAISTPVCIKFLPVK